MDNLKNKTQSCARIQKIEIRKLFNMFDYDIEIDAGNDVSVLIAPNGCGKTTIFNFILSARELPPNFNTIVSTDIHSFYAYV